MLRKLENKTNSNPDFIIAKYAKMQSIIKSQRYQNSDKNIIANIIKKHFTFKDTLELLPLIFNDDKYFEAYNSFLVDFILTNMEINQKIVIQAPYTLNRIYQIKSNFQLCVCYFIFHGFNDKQIAQKLYLIASELDKIEITDKSIKACREHLCENIFQLLTTAKCALQKKLLEIDFNKYVPHIIKKRGLK